MNPFYGSLLTVGAKFQIEISWAGLGWGILRSGPAFKKAYVGPKTILGREC